MKDIEWLKEEIEEDIESWGGGNPDYFRGANDAYDNVKDWLDQLDEPEVLSQEFIDKYKVDYDNWMPAVPIVHLQNLLVPKQEITEDQAWDKIAESYPAERVGLQNAFEHFYYGGFMTDEVVEKPVIPQFVADWIEEMKQDERPLYSVMSSLMNKTNHEWAVWKSANKNFSEVVAQAWLDGYTVEKEPKYYVLSKDRKTILLERWASGISPCAMPISEKEEGDMLTEQEIKDYDERYWAFAVKVEELEE